MEKEKKARESNPEVFQKQRQRGCCGHQCPCHLRRPLRPEQVLHKSKLTEHFGLKSSCAPHHLRAGGVFKGHKAKATVPSGVLPVGWNKGIGYSPVPEAQTTSTEINKRCAKTSAARNEFFWIRTWRRPAPEFLCGCRS